MGQTQEVKMTAVRTCDVCGTAKTFVQIQGAPIVSREQLLPLEGWYVITKDHILGEAIAPIGKIACSRTCAISLVESNLLEPPAPLDFKAVESNLLEPPAPLDFKAVN